jgi:hypothetical protein
MERCTNEKRFNMAAHVKISAERKQWSINGNDGGLKTVGDLRLPALPCGSGALKTQLIDIEARDSCCSSRF